MVLNFLPGEKAQNSADLALLLTIGECGEPNDHGPLPNFAALIANIVDAQAVDMAHQVSQRCATHCVLPEACHP